MMRSYGNIKRGWIQNMKKDDRRRDNANNSITKLKDFQHHLTVKLDC